MNLRLVKNGLFLILFFGILYVLYTSFDEYYIEIFTEYAPNPEIKVHPGDSSIWRLNEYDDSQWSTHFPEAPYFAWIRAWVTIDSTSNIWPPYGIGIWHFTSSYDLFWDGNYIGSNGVLTNGEEQDPGVIDKIFYVQDSLSIPGRHLIAMRASQQHQTAYSTRPYFILQNYDIQSQSLIIIAVFIHLFSGVFFIISIYYFFVYYKSYRRKIFLNFGIICSVLFVLSILTFIRYYYKYPYPFHFPKYISIEFLTFVLAIITSYYFLLLYEVKKRRFYLAGLILLSFAGVLIFEFHTVRSFYFFAIGILFSFILNLVYFIKGKKDSLISLYSIIPPLVLTLFLENYFFNMMLFISYFGFIVFNLYTLSRTIGQQRKDYERFLVESNRLKVELLKKNIQPHFIMNTLTSLISWVEESPIVAIQFIEALAEEFRILVDMSEKDRIPIHNEIKLCETHMEVMSFRNEVKYRLETSGIEMNEDIPPAIFLTLTENGITHNIHDSEEVVFTLSLEKSENSLTYIFFSPGINQNEDPEITEGTGLKYIRARLSELYGENWDIKSGSKNNGWETRIKINMNN